MLKAIAAFGGRLFGSPKAMDAAIDGAYNGIDKLIYTNEERADDARKDTAEFRGVMVEWFRNSQGQNLSRRFLAISISITWLSMYLLSSFTYVAAIFTNPEMADKLKDAAGLVGSTAERLNGAVMLIIGFYFAAPHLGAIIKPAMEKFAGKEPATNK